MYIITGVYLLKEDALSTMDRKLCFQHYREGGSIYDTRDRELHPINCLEDVNNDRTKTIIVREVPSIVGRKRKRDAPLPGSLIHHDTNA